MMHPCLILKADLLERTNFAAERRDDAAVAETDAGDAIRRME